MRTFRAPSFSDDLSVFLHGLTHMLLPETNPLVGNLNLNSYDGTEKVCEIDLKNAQHQNALDFLKTYDCPTSEDWWYIDDDKQNLQTVKDELRNKGYLFVAARIRRSQTCSTPTSNFHIDCPFGIQIDEITTPAHRAVLQSARFTGYHNFIMTISDNEECTTRFITHNQVKYNIEQNLRHLDLHAKRQAVLNDPRLCSTSYDDICKLYVANNPDTLKKIPVNRLTNRVDYNFHRGPIPSDFTGNSPPITERTLVHIYCTKAVPTPHASSVESSE